MEQKRYYEPTGRLYTFEQFIEEGLPGLPNVDHLQDIWERLPVIAEYDSTADTLMHIKRVNALLLEVVQNLLRRAVEHDNSKLSEQEKPYFDKLTPLLAKSEFGSRQYNEFIKELKPALKHHYARNSHHPEHYRGGILDMDLFDIVEMFCDWKAASERHETGNIYRSIEYNSSRFKMTKQLKEIFINTAARMGF